MHVLISIVASTIVALAWGVHQRNRGFAEGRKDGLAVGFDSGLREGRRLEKTARRIETIRRWAKSHAPHLLTVDVSSWKLGKRCPVCNSDFDASRYNNS